MINQLWINRYKELVKKYNKKEIDDKNATEQLTKLINLIRIFYR